ncbi:FecCD family ABC transporter permease [Nocardiopsis valliformis]|uniref:FecCD family ABC transporter permease n=1 Tax=Nocardiopsis valliformis TaxID=239974 RepID=UPI00034A9B5C|nr:iron chelate uptake ABC transporter family permease subunit [Nocardiopsis valliformis]
MTLSPSRPASGFLPTLPDRSGLRFLGVTSGTLALLLVSIGVAITLGPADVSLVNVRDIVLNHLGITDVPVRVSKDAIVWNDRLPRSLVAAACGAGLGLCGVILQSLLRNPLADPYVLGISSGASTGAVVIGILGIGGTALGVSGGAFIGSVTAFTIVLLLVGMTGGGNDKVILAGIAVTQLFSALTSFVVFAFADSDQARGVMFWLLGSLEGVRWNDVVLCGLVVLAGTVFCLLRAPVLDAFAFGDDVASSLGVSVRQARITFMTVTALLTATMVSVAGAIGFVGLVLPHAARFLTGPLHARLVPVTALAGAVFMVWVDAISRVAFAPSPLPIGVGTALVGVPVFIGIMFRRRRTL